MMLVPEPAYRADISVVMVHPWLAAYTPLFQNCVDDLVRAAIEQHQMKRLAYERQMKQPAAATESQTKVSHS
jgi:protein-serine/threonine kinase